MKVVFRVSHKIQGDGSDGCIYKLRLVSTTEMIRGRMELEVTREQFHETAVHQLVETDLKFVAIEGDGPTVWDMLDHV